MRPQPTLPAAPRRCSLRRHLLLTTALIAASTVAFASVLPPAAADEISDKRGQAAQVAAELESLEAREMSLSAEAERAKAELADAEAAVADAERRSAEADAELEQRQQELRSFAIDAYVTGSDAPGIDAILSSQIDDSAKVRGYVDITGGNRQDKIDQLRATRLKAEREGEELEAARGDLEARHAQLDRSLDEAQAAVDEQQSIKDRLDGEVADLVAAERAREAEAARAAAANAATSAPRVTAPRAAAAAPAPARPTGPPPAVGSGAQFAIDAAMSKIGAPYVWAAAGPDSFDCSGLTMWAWRHGGKSLSHYTGSQLAQSTRISAAEAQPGDLVFFWGPGDGGDPGHVGLYLGGGSFVHAPGRGKFVRVDSVGYWSGAHVAYGRGERLSPISPIDAIVHVPAGARRLMLGLHGHGDEPASVQAKFSSVASSVGAALVVPTGPVTAPGGRAWFASGPTEAGPPLGEVLDSLQELISTTCSSHRLDPDDVIVMGWSQGGAAALTMALRATTHPRPRTVVGLAAWLPAEPDVKWDFAAAAAAGVRVLLVHGIDDDVVSPTQGVASRRALERRGVDVTWIEVIAGHDLAALIGPAASWLTDADA